MATARSWAWLQTSYGQGLATYRESLSLKVFGLARGYGGAFDAEDGVIVGQRETKTTSPAGKTSHSYVTRNMCKEYGYLITFGGWLASCRRRGAVLAVDVVVDEEE